MTLIREVMEMAEGVWDLQYSDMDAWAMLELGNTDLGDVRRTQRLVRLTSALARYPACSLPEACNSWASTKAGYRFLDNDDIQPEAILSGHRQSTLKRIGEHPVVLAIQDTSLFNFTSHPATKGLGPIGRYPNQKVGAKGFLVHSCLAVTPEGVPLGMLGQKVWSRPETQNGLEDNETSQEPESTKDEKESVRWIEMLTSSTQGLPPETRVITVADREADIYEFFATAQRSRRDVLVRASHNRWLAGRRKRLWGVLEEAEVLGTMQIEIPRADNRPARSATLELRAALVHLQSPKTVTKVLLSAVQAREVNPPKGEKRIEWRLLTTLPVATVEEASTCVCWYTKRWTIERYHYTLKSGCQIEELQLETVDRLHRALAVYAVVAWRLLHLTYVAREEPDGPCTTVLSDAEWKVLYVLTQRTKQLPKSPPTLKTAVRWVAQLGGFLGRKHDGDPGVKVLWKGYRRLQENLALWNILQT